MSKLFKAVPVQDKHLEKYFHAFDILGMEISGLIKNKTDIGFVCETENRITSITHVLEEQPEGSFVDKEKIQELCKKHGYIGAKALIVELEKLINPS